MIRKKKNRFWTIRKASTFLIFSCIAGFGAWQHRAIASFARGVVLVYSAPDALVLLRSFRHDMFGILCMKRTDAADECSVFGADGIIFAGARTVVGDMIVRIDDASGERLAIGSAVIDADSWRNIVPVIRFARGEGSDISVLVLKRAEREIDAVTAHGTVFRFSYEFDPSAHVRALPALRERVSLDSLQYLDMRVENKIFYK